MARNGYVGFREGSVFVFRLILAACVLVLVSCSRTRAPAAAESSERSVEDRVAELEQRLNGNARPLDEAEVRKEWEHDYAEIESLGLVERAYRDFSARLTNATVEAWTIGYLRDTNLVWCEVQYRVPGSETLEQGFGYQRQAGTNWNLVWKDVRSGNQ